MAAAKAPAPKNATQDQVDKVLSQLSDFNLRIGDLFRVTSGGVAGAAAAASGVNGTPVTDQATETMGGLDKKWIWIGLAGAGAVLFYVFRKKF